MSAGGHVIRNRIALRASVDLNTLLTPGVYGLEAPSNGPNADNCIVEVYVAVDGATRYTVQRAVDLTDGTVNQRFNNGSAWGDWAAFGAGGTDTGLAFKGTLDVTSNPNYPAGVQGDIYFVVNSGHVGGASGPSVNPGDLIVCVADNAGGNQATVGTSWSAMETNHDGVVVGPGSATGNNFTQFNGPTGKLIKDSGIALDLDGALAANSDSKLASQKATKTYADAAQAAAQAASIPLTYLDTGSISTNSDAKVPSQKAVKTYVDAAIQGLQMKGTARLATSAALSPTNTYSAGVLTAGSNGALSIDGQTVAVNDIVLIKDEASQLKNGLYVINATGDGSNPYAMTRHVDMDAAAEFVGGFIVIDSTGTLNANSLWLCTNASAPTVGTTAITFVELNKGTDLAQGTGIAISGNSVALSANALIGNIQFVIDGGGSAITTGLKGYIEVPFGCTITRATLLADQSGSIVVNIYKCSYANFDVSTHPVVGDKITSSTPPTITSAVKSQDSTLTSWTTAISAGDILAINVDSITTVTRVTLSLKVNRT